MSEVMNEEQDSSAFLPSILNKTLHISIVDGRLFTGSFRCTDNESNIILSNAFEYRDSSQLDEQGATQKTSRFLGLIVVPKHQTAKIELEERRNEPNVQELPFR